ncbi:MAG: acetate kinase [Bacteroidales bacterium]|nr:acetate kinase [Bacteroidales bacterium]MBO7132643.1 acetate kinase [Bacteroidales bacterium]MBR4584898.1 acetate kinase [Bacteroidales bacterium]
MKILVLNCGSSSIKYQLINIDANNNSTVMAKGLLERIGLEMGEFTHKYNGQKHYEQTPIADHTAGIRMVLKALTDPEMGVIKDLKEIEAVGNRVAHGGELFKASALVNDDVIEKIKSLMELAPLHTPGNLAGIYAMREVLPNVPQAVVFDTAFHQTLPPKSFLYGLPYEYYQKYHLRRYGFHGTSHGFVAEKAAKMIGKDWKDLKIISCHLGSGASIAAIDHGKSVDTTMGLTALEGLIMGSRPGDVDPGAVLYIVEKELAEGKTMKDITNIFYKKSGLVGISGGKQDMRDIRAGRDAGDERSTYAFDMFAQRVKRYIGGYMAEMGGCDILLFTGGIGENAWFMRHPILENMECLGIKVDMEKNDKIMGEDAVISTPDSKVTTIVVTTDEEYVIAMDTMKLVQGK